MSSGRDPRASEARLEAIRREAAQTGAVGAAGARVAGGPIPPEASGAAAAAGYYGRPLLKPPVWTWEVPLYFYVGGLAGMAAVVAAAARVAAADPALVRAAAWLAVAGAGAAPVLLVLDLGRPARFLNMLRVFKWRSPMSMGVWILLAFSAAAGAAALLLEWTAGKGAAGGATAVGLLTDTALLASAPLGALLATYTGVLIGATAVPAWLVHHRSLPVHFGVAGLGSAVGALVLLGFREPALLALGTGAAAVETAFGAWIELRRHGAADRALHRGASGLTLRLSGLLTGPASLALWLLGFSSWAAIAFLAGSLASRYGWLWAGRESARDPEAALAVTR